MSLHIPDNYKNLLGNVENTEKAIKAVKDMFQDNLSAQLALLRVTEHLVGLIDFLKTLLGFLILSFHLMKTE